MKTIQVELKGEALEEFERLEKTVSEEQKSGIKNSENQQLLKSIKQKVELIKINPQYGDPVSKNLIRKSGLSVTNLRVIDLTGYWRMLYTIVGNRIEIICFILMIIDHNKYNKLFGYRKK